MSNRSGILRNVSFRTKVERKSNSCSTRTVENPMKNEVGRGGFIFGCVVLKKTKQKQTQKTMTTTTTKTKKKSFRPQTLGVGHNRRNLSFLHH